LITPQQNGLQIQRPLFVVEFLQTLVLHTQTKPIVLLVMLTVDARGLQVIHAALSMATKVDAKGKLAVLGSRHRAQLLAIKEPAKATLAVLGLTRRKTVLAWMKQRVGLLADVRKTLMIVLITAMVAVTAQLVMQQMVVVIVPMIAALALALVGLGTLVVLELTIRIRVQERMRLATVPALTARHAAERQRVAALMIQQIATPSLDALGKPLLH
jgi:hypothetical protein